MDKGTIIYVGNFELPDKNAAAHRVVNNARIFSALGFRVVLFGVARGDAFSGARKVHDSELKDQGDPSLAVRDDKADVDLWERAYPVSTADWVRQLFDVSDVETLAQAYDDLKLVIAYNLPFATFKALKKRFLRRGVDTAYDCTEWNGYAEGSLPKRLYKKHDEKLLRTKLGKQCRDLIVISSAMERQYAGANLLRLPPLVDIEDPIWSQVRQPHDGVFEFCFAGTVSNKERLDRVVEAFCALDAADVRLRVVGLSRSDFEAAYPDCVSSGDKRIAFEGYLSHSDAVRRVLSCDCYVFIRETTSRNTAGFPTKFAEAFTCGVPIITTDVSDVAGYIAPDKGIVLRCASVDAIRAAMSSAIEAFRGRTPALNDTFDWRKHVDRTREWINKVTTY